nr:F-box/kelch-repeat protein At3g23880-like [Nicotiana tomentosiformis]
MPDNFPRDITIDILIKLPVSSILRFNCVCKSWRSLIEDRQFIKQHYDRYKNDTNFHKIFLACIKYQYHCQQYYSIDAPFQHDSGISLLEHPPKINHTLTREFVVSSCKYGLFLLAFSYDKIILWNPTIRESRTIPRAIQIEKERSYDLRFWMQPVGFIRDGDMLFLRDKTEFVIYDSKRHFQKVKVVELEESLCLNWAVTYVETLISPNAI